jgi:chorismate mutase
MELNRHIIRKNNLLIAGPCSLESEEQIISIAHELKNSGKVDVLRAGIWKPRTNPGQFEGLGTKALPWLAEAKRQTGLPTTAEVGTAKHVEDALHFDVDILWIGARTTVNPFAVQAIADALQGTNIPVMIKNPVSADTNLWLGAVERIQKAGIKNIALVHRGFTSSTKSNYRNPPLWHIAMEMKQRFPDYPMICDPSHICGNRDELLEVAQKSLDLGMNGLMVETHQTPDQAWTDSKQQITPDTLIKLLDSLNYNNLGVEQRELTELRERINTYDDEILRILSNRMIAATKIGGLKRKNNMELYQPLRWKEVVDINLKKANNLNLNENFVETYLEALHKESLRIQELVSSGKIVIE